MSDDWLILIPDDPHHVPDEAQQQRARDQFARLAPRSDEIEVNLTESVQLIDCGGNFERVLCPSCGAEIPVDWWQDQMSEDYNGGFKLDSYAMPCCQAVHAMNELTYEWPMGFSRFSLSARNPRIGLLEEKHKAGFESILGVRLRVIYQHI